MGTYEYLKIIATVSGIMTTVLGLPVTLLLQRYKSLLSEHKEHGKGIVAIDLARVETVGKIINLENTKISRPELDIRLEKFEQTIVSQMKDSDERNRQGIISIKDDVRNQIDYVVKLLERKD